MLRSAPWCARISWDILLKPAVSPLGLPGLKKLQRTKRGNLFIHALRRGSAKVGGRITALTSYWSPVPIVPVVASVPLDDLITRGTYMDPPALSRRLQVKITRFGTDAAIYPASE